MPIEKVPVVHRFGIISHNQRIDLQDRLLKKALEAATARPYDKSSRNPNDLPESFVHQFNSAKSVNEKEKCEDIAKKHLERLKTKSGLSKHCEVTTKQMDEVWVDLTILSQCKGSTQEASLDLLISTLDQAPFDRGHIQGLFFLAETALYWLRTDAINSPYLRTSELKLLKMAHMVFMRLFYHHMVGDLRGHSLFKNRLFMYLDGLTEFQEAYSPYPNAHLSLRYIIEIGKVIFLDEDLDPGEMKEADDTDQSHFTHQTESRRSKSAKSEVSKSVHDLTPTLWHSLDVWRCVSVSGDDLDVAVKSIANCGLGMGLESWVDGAAALVVLGDASRVNICVLKTLQDLACGFIPAEHEEHLHPATDGVGSIRNAGGGTANKSEADYKYEAERMEAELNEAMRPTRTPRKVTRQSQRSLSRGRSPEDALATGHRPHVGTQFDERGNITPTTYRNSPFSDTPGIQGWSWEVAVMYTEIMADLVVTSHLSSVQKHALLGNNSTLSEVRYQNSRPPLESAGVLDLLYFAVLGESLEHARMDWSWRIRYTAVQGLVHICKALKGNKMCDGLYSIAWSALLDAQAHESDDRVLEALKVGQVNVQNQRSSNSSSSRKYHIGGRLADGLGKKYLPPLTSPVKSIVIKQRQKKQTSFPIGPRKPVRTTLGNDLELCNLTNPPVIPDYKERANKDLMRIVEDQWRKDLQDVLKLEEERAAQEKENLAKQLQEQTTPSIRQT